MKYRFLFCLFFLCITSFSVNAAHIIGGSAAYEVINHDQSNTTLSMDFILYRDTNGGGANFDNFALFGIFGASSNGYTFLTSVGASVENIETLNLEYPDNCPELIYEKGSYSFDVILENASYDHYVIAYQRCCRSDNISNILDPEESGFALSIKIYPKAFEYTERAIELDELSLPFLLHTDDEHTIDLVIDDSYVKDYRLTAPLVAGGISGVTFGDPEACDGITPNPINCPPPFARAVFIDEENPYGIDSDVTLDQVLGELNVQIPTVGITLFEMTVDRYIDGELLSSINNQWTTTTSICMEPLSIGDNTYTKEVNLSPNPAMNSINLSSALSDIVILDALGKQVMSLEKGARKEDISIALLSPGAYILKGLNENGDLIKLQFIKSHL